MPITKQQKAVILDDVAKLAQAAKIVVLADYRGIKVEDITQLRRNVRAAKGLFRVVKNTLSRRVFVDEKFKPLAPMFRGPVGLTFGLEEPVELVKKLTEFARTNDKFQLKGALMDGQLLSTQDLSVLATLPSKSVLYAQIMGLIDSPVGSFLGFLDANVSCFLLVLKGLEEKRAGEQEGAPQA
ncbi:MAG: 50S ribosomal protein L10 [Candidatus Riflebacteria bacterium]|nr:50S ribosomal protein L10 [Candidatus Riflebacteria bacterium]